jgi:hypothetical protein
VLPSRASKPPPHTQHHHDTLAIRRRDHRHPHHSPAISSSVSGWASSSLGSSTSLAMASSLAPCWRAAASRCASEWRCSSCWLSFSYSSVRRGALKNWKSCGRYRAVHVAAVQGGDQLASSDVLLSGTCFKHLFPRPTSTAQHRAVAQHQPQGLPAARASWAAWARCCGGRTPASAWPCGRTHSPRSWPPACAHAWGGQPSWRLRAEGQGRQAGGEGSWSRCRGRGRKTSGPSRPAGIQPLPLHSQACTHPPRHVGNHVP